jgi:hypothetical protein
LALVLFGILQILIGIIVLALAGLPVAAIAVAVVRGSRVPPTIVLTALILLLEGAWLVGMGIGSLLTRRWGRALSLVTAWIWLLSGILGMAGLVPAILHGQRKLAVSGWAIPPMAGIAYSSVFLVLLPALFVSFYGKRDVKATCEHRRPKASWTDRCPLPVLALSLLAVFWAIIPLTGSIMNWTVPFFGTVLRGTTGAIASLIVAGLYASAARGLYNLDKKSWWLLVAVLIGGAVSTTLTLYRVGILGICLSAGLSDWEIAAVRRVNPWPLVLGTIAAIAYALYLRTYFEREPSGGRPRTAADTPGWAAGVARTAEMGRRCLLTRRARIAAAGAVGILLLGSTIGYFVNERLRRHQRLSDCDFAGGKSSRTSERDSCLAKAAKLWSKPEYCDDIDDFESKVSGATNKRAECRSEVAAQLGNLGLCKRSGTRAATRQCVETLAVRAEDPEICRQVLHGIDLDGCVHAIARQAMRGDLCVQIKRADWRRACLKGFMSNGGDESDCGALAARADREVCIEGLSESAAATCMKLSPDKRGSCLKKNPDLLDDLRAACEGSAQCLSDLNLVGTVACGLIPDDQAPVRLKCFDTSLRDSLKLRGPSAWIRDSECGGLGTPRLRDECFYRLGLFPDHPGACLKVSDASLRHVCLQVASVRDAAICLALKDKPSLEACVASSQLDRTIDGSICRFLPSKERTGCVRQVNANLEGEVRDAVR